MALPPGFRFHPTDEELVAYYLRKKIGGRAIDFNIITEIDLYRQEPWDLPEKSFFCGSDMEWYFFSPRDKKYPNGLRTNRATEAGYWKATGKDRNVKKAGRVIGMKKTLVFYRGRAPNGERTDWVMHEYRLDEEECEKLHASQDLFVLCRVFKKSGVGPRSGEDRGPQTYVDDDTDKEPSGTFADAVKRALEPEPTPILAVQPSPLETPKNDRVESSSVSASSLSVDYYALGEGAGHAADVAPADNYTLDEVIYPPSEEHWDCFSSITAGMDLPSAEPDGPEPFSASPWMVDWQVDADAESANLGGMMWSSDLSGTSQLQPHFQLDFLSGGVGSQLEMESLQLELQESDDVLPPLVDELEPSNPFDSEASAVAHNFGENAYRGRTAARARERAPRHQPTSDEDQQRARSSNDGLSRPEATPQPRMSNTNFREPEVPSQARGGSAGLNVTRPTPEASALINFHTNQQPSSSDYASSASTPGFDASGIPAGDDDPYSSQEFFFDFALDDELINFATDDGLSSGAPHGVVGDQGGPESLVPPHPDKSAKHAKGAVSEGPARFTSSPQGGPLEEKKPLSKPLAGLLRLLGSLPAQPASAAECPPDMKPLQTNAEVGSTYSSIHVSAVTVTCTSSADGAQKVEAAVTDCHLEGDARGVYQQVVSGSWQAIPLEKGAAQEGSDEQSPVCALCDTAATSGVLRRRVARGSSSGFVFVFVLGAMSALCWFLLLRGMWRLVSHVSNFVF